MMHWSDFMDITDIAKNHYILKNNKFFWINFLITRILLQDPSRS